MGRADCWSSRTSGIYGCTSEWALVRPAPLLAPVISPASERLPPTGGALAKSAGWKRRIALLQGRTHDRLRAEIRRCLFGDRAPCR